MEVSLLRYQVADLCLGKPPLRSLSAAYATVGDVVSAFNSSSDACISVWSCGCSCDHDLPAKNIAGAGECRCVGKVCMVDVICYLCKERRTLSSPSLAFSSPVSVLLRPEVSCSVRHVEPSASLLEAMDLIRQGSQNLVVPIKSNSGRKLQKSSTAGTAHNGREFCWVTQEDIIRFLLSSIGLFSPIPAMSVDSLGLISSKFLTIGYHAPALSATGRILLAAAGQTSVAVVDDDGLLIGEISPAALNGCGETAAAAIATLSAGDLMAYIDGGSPPEDLIRVVEARLRDMDLKGMLEEFAAVSGDSPASSSSSEDEELQSPTSMLARLGRYRRSSSFCVGGAAVCQRHSSLAAVTIQAISHRVNYIWVVEEDGELIGIVTFPSILGVFHECLESMA